MAALLLCMPDILAPVGEEVNKLYRFPGWYETVQYCIKKNMAITEKYMRIYPVVEYFRIIAKIFSTTK